MKASLRQIMSKLAAQAGNQPHQLPAETHYSPRIRSVLHHCDNLGPIARANLAQDIVHVSLYRPGGNDQGLRNTGI